MPEAARRAVAWMAPAAVALLAACGQGENDPGPGGVTVSEARALDEAAQMLDERRPPIAVVPAEPGEQVAPQAPAPQP